MKKCKRCLSNTALTADEIEKMVSEVRNMKGIRLADEAEYKRRFEICLKCDKLEYGSTCMLSGCVMQVRARLYDGRCPYPKGGKW